MGVFADACEVLNAGRLHDASGLPGRAPRAVAFSRRGDRGAVMFLVRRTTADWMAIVVLLERDGTSWDDVWLVHNPWWDPVEPFDAEELVLTGGHSRFGQDPEVVLIPGQAAPGARVSCDERAGDGVVVHPPWGHFVYLGECGRSDETLTLTARRAGAEETLVFEPIGHR